MARTRKRVGRARWGLVAAFTAIVAASGVFALPVGANPPDPTRPDIELTVRASIDRPYSWAIEKKADKESVKLQPGETATVNYSVTVTPTEGATGWSAFGEIFVYNKELEPLTVNSVTNDISGVGPATVACQGDPLPRQLNSGAQIRCRFTADLPDNSDRVSTATASVGSSEFTVSAPIEFATALDNRIDTCVAVYDSMLGLLDEQTCVNKADKTVEYSVEVGPYEKCGDHRVENTAWAITNHTDTRVEDSFSVKVDVPCPPRECKDKDKYGWWHDRDHKCDRDDDLCDKNDKDRHGWFGWFDNNKCDRDHDRDDRDRCKKDHRKDGHWGWDRDYDERDKKGWHWH